MTMSRRVVAAIARLLITGLLIIATSGVAVSETITRSAGLTADISSDGRIALVAGMIDLIHKGFFSGAKSIVFVHTGGSAGLFGYSDLLNTSI